MKRAVLLALLFAVLLFAGVSCGGGAGITQLGDAKDVQGITEAGFNLVRYDDQGNATNALNPTLDLAVQQSAGTTTVQIAIDDSQPTLGVTCDLHYDPSRFTPVDVQFAGLIDTQVELAVTRIGGLVAVGQVSTDGAAQRSGDFATVTFRNEPNRNVSDAGDAADKPINVSYSANGFSGDGFTAVESGGAVDVNILGIFTSLSGDGDQNGASNIADLTPLGAQLGVAVSATDAASARADYDGNGLPNISDLTPLGANLGEGTTGIELLASDTDPPTTGDVVHTFDWTADGDPPVSFATDTGDPNDVWRQFQFTLDAATADTVDANDDGTIFLSARAITSNAGGNPGPAFTPAVQVDNVGNVITSNFVVTGLTIEANGNPVSNGDTVALEANSTATFEVTGFTGTYNGTAFTSGDVGGTVPQAEYDTELAAIQQDFYNWVSDATHQTLNPTSVASFETDYTAVLNGWAVAGTTATATVFPDNDDANAAEGSLTLGFTRSNNTVADATITLDVTADPDAPLVDAVSGNAGQDGNGNWIVTNVDPDIKGHLTFPGGAPGTFDDTTIDVKLVDLTNNVELPIEFDFQLAPPTLAGTFNLTPSIGPGYDFIVRVPGGSLSSSNLYMVRFFSPAAENPSSVNYPGEFLTGGTVPSGFSSHILPRPEVNASETTIAIIPADPRIVRNPQQDYDVIGGTVNNHYPGAGDVLKSSGDSFTLEISGTEIYPQVVIKAGNDPSVILADDVPQAGPIQLESNPHRILVDISALDDHSTTTQYAYKVFGAPVTPGALSSRPVITSGTFNHHATGDDAIIANLNGIDFGVNIYDSNPPANQADLPLGAENFGDKFISVGSLPANYGDAADADVLFVQFNGGHIVPQPYPAPNMREGFDTLGGSVQVILKELTLGSPQISKPLDVRIAGIGTGGLDYIGLAHYVASEDVGPAGLVPTLEYEVILHDGFGGPDFSFGNTNADPHITVVN